MNNPSILIASRSDMDKDCGKPYYSDSVHKKVNYAFAIPGIACLSMGIIGFAISLILAYIVGVEHLDKFLVSFLIVIGISIPFLIFAALTAPFQDGGRWHNSW